MTNILIWKLFSVFYFESPIVETCTMMLYRCQKHIFVNETILILTRWAVVEISSASIIVDIKIKDSGRWRKSQWEFGQNIIINMFVIKMRTARWIGGGRGLKWDLYMCTYFVCGLLYLDYLSINFGICLILILKHSTLIS